MGGINRQREGWIDAARGIAIILVVLGHVARVRHLVLWQMAPNDVRGVVKASLIYTSRIRTRHSYYGTLLGTRIRVHHGAERRPVIPFAVGDLGLVKCFARDAEI